MNGIGPTNNLINSSTTTHEIKKQTLHNNGDCLVITKHRQCLQRAATKLQPISPGVRKSTPPHMMLQGRTEKLHSFNCLLAVPEPYWQCAGNSDTVTS